MKIEFKSMDHLAAKHIGEALVKIAKEWEAWKPEPAPVEDTNTTTAPAPVEDTNTNTTTAPVEDTNTNTTTAPVEDTSATAPAPVEDTNTTTAPAPVDNKGVAFDGEYCGKAAKPFYSSGPRAGQWKKRKGVTDLEYDRWYAVMQTKATPPTAEPKPMPTAEQVFGQPETEKIVVPKKLGEFMAWVSEQQTAGKLTPDGLSRAYAETGHPYADALSPDESVVEKTIADLYNYLTARIG